MGVFSRKNKIKTSSPLPLTDVSLLSPPNVYYTSAPPILHQPKPVLKPGMTSREHQAYNNNKYYYSKGHHPHTTISQSTDSSQPNRQGIHKKSQVNPQDNQYLSPYREGNHLGRFTCSMSNLVTQVSAIPNCTDPLTSWYGYGTQVVGALDEVSQRLNHILTLIDEERLMGNETDLFISSDASTCYQQPLKPKRSALALRDQVRVRLSRRDLRREERRVEQQIMMSSTDVAASVVRGNYFSKTNLYSNSKLPRALPPFAVYPKTWPLLTLAAQYSLKVYAGPTAPSEGEHHLSASLLSATKAMTLKSIPMDHMHTIIFAIRGTATFMDWAVNLTTSPTSPHGFLDDPGNLCHAGFLSVARRMIRPVAARLREMLREDPGRARYSLIITGHSAGGAVAALLYAHMLSETQQSELSILTRYFKRVHCVTFGTPPISLLPLERPNRADLKNSVFLSFVNEGDPVVRADKAYVRSLLELLASPPPPATKHTSWTVPPGTLSLAGRIVVLRSNSVGGLRDGETVRERLLDGVRANVCVEDDLRGLIWGDPVAHLMSLYAGRIEALALGGSSAVGR